MRDSITVIGCLLQMAFYFIIVGGMTLWTDRNLDFWISYFKDAPTDVPLWLSFLLSVFAPFTFAGNVIAEIARFCV